MLWASAGQHPYNGRAWLLVLFLLLADGRVDIRAKVVTLDCDLGVKANVNKEGRGAQDNWPPGACR